ncbi:MAG TPA: glycosyltransferase [Streptosporangiaceae bacterium]
MTPLLPDYIDVSVIVATRGRQRGCQRLVRAIADQFLRFPETSYEVLLVFDGCEVYDWVDPADAHMRVQQLYEHAGIARARNAGIDAARGQLLAFLDDDCVPSATWLADLLRMSHEYPECVAFGGKVIGTDTANLYAQLRDAVYYLETFGTWYVDTVAAGDVVGAPYVNGGNSAYRRRALVESGGFDEILPAYSDVELGRRLRLEQRAVLCATMAIHHDHPADFRQYMLRCWRSGSARGLLWACRGYPQDAPVAVVRAIVVNIAWRNAVRRRRRVSASPIHVISVLLCQEVVHGLGYLHAVTRHYCRGRAHRRTPAAPSVGGRASSP